jgi:hypothetical protein
MTLGKRGAGLRHMTEGEWDTLFELMADVLNLPVVPVEEEEQVRREARAIIAIKKAQQRDADGVLEDFVSLFSTLEPS